MRRIAIIFLSAFLAVHNAAAGDIGRLFFTPEQRIQLEREYVHRTATPDKNRSTPMLNGVVQKSNGPRTIWINGVPKNAESSGGQAPDTQAITLGASRAVQIKVGQRLPP